MVQKWIKKKLLGLLSHSSSSWVYFIFIHCFIYYYSLACGCYSFNLKLGYYAIIGGASFYCYDDLFTCRYRQWEIINCKQQSSDEIDVVLMWFSFSLNTDKLSFWCHKDITTPGKSYLVSTHCSYSNLYFETYNW